MYGKISVCMHKSDNQELVQTDPRDALLYGIMLYTHVDERSVWYLTLGLLSSFWNRYHSTTAYFLTHPAVASLPALGPWAPPAECGPSLESIYRVSLTVDVCEGNKIISFKKLFHHSQLGALKKKKIRGPWARTQCAHWLRRPWHPVV